MWRSLQRVLSVVVLSLGLATAALAVEFPKIDRRPAPWDPQRGFLESVPKYDPANNSSFQVDLRGYNLSRLDLREAGASLEHADFDDRTIWPALDRLPRDFDPRRIMEMGKNPGLGVRSLHAQGITGRGVGIAVIDNPLLTEHQEYAPRLRLYEEINVWSVPGLSAVSRAHMHGPAVASIAVGKTVGVAPEADLYYIGRWAMDMWRLGRGEDRLNFQYDAQAVRRVLQINEQLPPERKIRVISISIGWEPGQTGYAEISAAVEEAKAAGMLVICSSVERIHGFKFHGLGRDLRADPNDFASYRPARWGAYANHDRLLVPMDTRTTASPTGPGDYVFYAEGGWSWAIPYIAGMYALVAQVDPKITPERFWALAMKTGRTVQVSQESKRFNLGPILAPTQLVEALRRGDLSDPAAVAAESAKYADVGVASARTRTATAQDQDKVTESLHQAVSEGDIKRVRSVLFAGAKVNEKGKDGQTALHLAAKSGHKDVVELLLAKGANVHAKDQNETTPLHTAASAGHKEIVQLLLTGGADANALQGEIRWTPLHGACLFGHAGVAELLIQNGAKVDAKASDGKAREYTPLSCALANEHYQTARVLVTHGADVTFTSHGDRPLLYYSLLGNDRDLVETMISKGRRAPALHLAAFRGDLANVKSLCATGIAVEARDEAQWTPLHWAVSGGRRDIAEFLLRHGADVNAKGLFNETPLHIAAYAVAGSRESVELLLSHGAGVDAVSTRGNRPLHYAAVRGHVPIVDVLLAHGVNIDVKNRDGKTPLYLSVEKGNQEASEFLIAKGADINTRENYQRTPLHDACRTGQNGLVELLLAKGADIQARDKYERTPISVAKNGGNGQIVDLLRRHGAKE